MRLARVLAVPALTFAVFAPGQTAAQELRVRSGEHEGFSRLVVEPPSGTGWTLGRAGAGYELRFDDERLGFDLSRVYDMIPRDRLAAITAGSAAGSLALGLGCDCHAVAFQTAGGLVVVDLRDGPPPEDSEFEAALDAGEDAPDASVDGAANASAGAGGEGDDGASPVPDLVRSLLMLPDTLPGADPDFAPLLRAAPETLPSRPLPAGPPVGRPATKPEPAPGEPGSKNAPPSVAPAPAGMSSAEEALLFQLGRAASQGLVVTAPQLDADVGSEVPVADARSGGTVGHSDGAEPSLRDSAGPGAPAAPADAASNSPVPGVEAQTSMDRDLLDAALGLPLTPEGAACPPDADFDVAAWAEGKGGYHEIAALQTGLIGEFDRPEPDAVTRLARAYLHYGFGAEARALLHAFEVPEEKARPLVALAYLIDAERTDATAYLREFAACEGVVALWAVLAGGVADANDDPVRYGAVLRTFSALPAGLRRHLGPWLSDILLSAGKPDVARAVRDAVARAPGADAADARLVDARLDVANGLTDRAQARFDTLAAEGNSETTVEAVLAAVNLRLDRGEAVPGDLAETVSALAFEHAEGEFGPALARAEVLALAAAGETEPALATFDTWQREHPGLLDPDVAERLFVEIAEFGDDAEVMSAYLDRANELPAYGLSAGAQTRLAARLVGAGFPGAALALLGDLPPGEEAGQLVLAEAALRAGLPEQALSALSGIRTEAAAILRAEALARAGRHDDAGREFETAGLIEAAAAQALLAGDLAGAAATADTARAEALRFLASGTVSPDAPRNPSAPEGTTPGAPGPLEDSRALLEDSAGLRAALSAILTPPEAANEP
jgi:hypothetical protein